MRAVLGKLLSAACFNHPIIVSGASRSGTSVLLQALGRHPAIVSLPGEAPYMTTIGGAGYIFNIGPDSQYYTNSLKFSKSHMHDMLKRFCFEYAAGRHYGLTLFLRGLAGKEFSYLNKKYWCAKTFPDVNSCLGLLELYPDMKIVYILRNGIDVVESRTRYAGFKDNMFEDHCRQWAHTVEKYRYLSKLDCVMSVRHEALVENPEKMFRDIFDFLKISFCKGPLDFVKNTLVHPFDHPTQENLSVKTAFENRPSPYDHWSEKKRHIFNSICGRLMDEVGYRISST